MSSGDLSFKLTQAELTRIEGSELEHVIRDCLKLIETGQNVSVDTVCEKYPDLADSIRSYFKTNALNVGASQVHGSDKRTANEPSLEIEGFVIRHEIGRGGMGIVFEGYQPGLDRSVAIKVLREGMLSSSASVARFEEEARLAAKMQHDNIVRVLDFGTTGTRHYMVMPLLSGSSLAKAIRKTPLGQAKVTEIMSDVANAIHHAHLQGVIHRDIKPGNIVSDDQLENVLVTDFGLAFFEDAEHRHTRTGQVVGTQGYIAPEVFRDKSRGDVLTDVYSLGATMYSMLTGVVPFRAATPADSVLLLLSTDLIPPRKLNPQIAVDIESICLKCMNPDRSRRYQTAAELEQDLRRFREHRPVLARPVTKLERATRWCKRNTTLAASMIAAMVLAFGLILMVTV